MEDLSQNRWFQDNVFFIFSSGCIFSDKDKEILDSILTYFDSGNPLGKYILNKKLFTNYEDAKMKEIESKLSIVNGNYHICAVIGVYDTADLKCAPESALSRHGLISYHLAWPEIRNVVLDYVQRYGYAIKPKIDAPQTDIRTFNKEIDIDAEALRQHLEIESEIKSITPVRGMKAKKAQRKSATEKIREDANMKWAQTSCPNDGMQVLRRHINLSN